MVQVYIGFQSNTWSNAGVFSVKLWNVLSRDREFQTNLQQKQQDKQGVTNRYLEQPKGNKLDFKLSAMGYSTVKNIIRRIIF